MADRALGMHWEAGHHEPNDGGDVLVTTLDTNTRTSLWPDRWPAIALQDCIDIVEATPVAKRPQAKLDLPCQDCHMNTACLNAKRKELGSLLYGREILTSPRSSEASLFPRTLWGPMLQPEMTMVPYWHKPFSVEHEYAIVQAWDIAWSEKTGGDWLVCITGYVHRPSGRRRLLDIERWQQVTFDDQVKMIDRKWKQYESDLVVIESDAAQQVWRQSVARNTAVPVQEHAAGEGKTSFAVGVPSLLIELENRKWEIPYQKGSPKHAEVVNLLDEFEAFGWNDGKLDGVGEHDDTVMAFWHLSWGMKRMLHSGLGGAESHHGNVPGARH